MDVFDSSCVYGATERGCAFTYANERVNPSHPMKEEDDSSGNDAAGDLKKESPEFEINLNDDK